MNSLGTAALTTSYFKVVVRAQLISGLVRVAHGNFLLVYHGRHNQRNRAGQNVDGPSFTLYPNSLFVPS